MPDNPDEYMTEINSDELELIRNKYGRDHTYDEEKASAVLAIIATGKSMRAACREVGLFPPTVRGWAMRDNPKGFADRYARARQQQMEAWAEDIVEISDDDSGDVSETADGRTYMNGEFVARSKLRVDSRKWLMARIGHQVYGDRTKTEVSGPGGGPIETTQLTPEQAAERLAALGLPAQVLEE